MRQQIQKYLFCCDVCKREEIVERFSILGITEGLPKDWIVIAHRKQAGATKDICDVCKKDFSDANYEML